MSDITARGIDVSYANGTVDWQRIRSNPEVDYALLRCGYGKLASQKDRAFEANYRGAKEAGIPVGVYHYSYAMNREEAYEEAAACLEIIRGKQFEYPVYFDFEETGAKYNQLALPAETKTAIITAFCEALEDAGCYAGVYSFASMLQDIYQSIRQFDIWVAHTGVQQPAFSGEYGMWQYSHTGNVPGANTFSGKCDLNYAYKDYPALIKGAGLNGFLPETYVYDVTARNMSTLGEAETIAGMIRETGYTDTEITRRKI